MLLKPIVVAPHGGVQMMDLDPTDPGAWFASYSTLLLQTATTAQFLNVGALSVGLELQRIVEKPENAERWAKLIAAVRGVYSGQLTYCSNPLTGETQAVPFWHLVDFIGLDLYVPLVLNRSADANLILSKQQMTDVFAFVMAKRVTPWFAEARKKLPPNMTMVITESGTHRATQACRVRGWCRRTDALASETPVISLRSELLST